MALEAILAHKREEVAARKQGATLDGLLAGCSRSTHSLAKALRAGRPGYILEIKFASPSEGVIRQGRDLAPILASYGRHADAVSVLTDTKFFGGSLQRLAEVRHALQKPLLCKDFILEPFQVAEARVHGADAILLILAAIDDDTWRQCALLAGRLGMDVLTEVHDEAEAARAVALGAAIIGINNRNLKTLEVDLGTLARLAPRVPADRLVVAESGYRSREDVVRHRPHADAFLVGSALMHEPELDTAVRHLVYGRTKICGLTSPDDARAALRAGATHGGLMFATSPRKIDLSQADAVARAAALQWVAVFADQTADLMADAVRRLPLTAVQLHGHESKEDVARLRTRLPAGVAVWKAARVQERVPLRAEVGADRLLLDGWHADRLGGSGTRFDWSLLDGHPERGDAILAGGLTPAVAEAAAAKHTWALDLSSGVESAPGRKDPLLLRHFFAARRHLAGRGDTE